MNGDVSVSVISRQTKLYTIREVYFVEVKWVVTMSQYLIILLYDREDGEEVNYTKDKEKLDVWFVINTLGMSISNL